MFRYLTIVFFCFSLCGFSQELPPVFKKSESKLNLGEIRDYYLNKYKDLAACDSFAKANSSLLKEKNQRHFTFNELARIQILSLQGNAVIAIEQLEELRKDPIFNNDNILLGYYNNIFGSIYYHFDQPDNAQEKYKKAVALFYTTTDSAGLKGNLINLGNTFLDLDKSDSALFYYNKALTLEKKGVLIFSNSLKSNIAQAYLRTGQLDSAKIYYNELVKDFRANNNGYKLPLAIMNLGITYKKLNNVDSAIILLKEAKDLATEYNLQVVLKKSTVHLALCYQLKSEFEIALNYFFEYDSILGVQHQIKLEEKIGEINLDHQKQIHVTKQNLINEKLENQKRKNLYLIITSSLIGAILIMILFFYLKIRAKNKTLIQSNLTKAKNDKRSFDINNNEIDQALIDKLIKAFKEDKIYLDPKLSLEKLAKKMGSNRTYVSKSINSYFKIPFTELINQYRIDEACVLLTSKEYANYSIEGVAQTVGYHNVSSFNSAFKRLTGTTPSRFKTSS